TTAGTSTSLTARPDKRPYEADDRFATLDATTKQINVADKFNVTLTDTVGFIQDLPTELISDFKSTLEESMNVDLLLH
ncbi:GTPase, partial [Streptococcus suis]